MSYTRLVILILLLPPFASKAQTTKRLPVEPDAPPLLENLFKRSINIGDSVIILLNGCKGADIVLREKEMILPLQRQAVLTEKKKAPFIRVHGNVLYNYSYRSYIDTPFAQNDLQQHLIQTTLNFTIRNKYPVRMTISSRSSNSPYFKNMTDVNVQFNRRQLLDNIKADLKAKAAGYIKIDALQKAEQLYNEKQNKTQVLNSWINSPARIQELVEEREKALRTIPSSLIRRPAVNLPKTTSLDDLLNGYDKKKVLGKISGKVKDSLDKLAAAEKSAMPDSSYLQKFNKKKEELAKLQNELKKTAGDIKKQKKLIQDSVNAIKKEINSLSNTAGLYAFMKKNGIAKDELTKAQRLLLAINQIGIGRSWVDYSELTVKNISLAGVNVEANPLPFYVAFAAGKVNYRFRDFIIKGNKELPGQSLYLVRAGIGQKEKNNFILTFYNGKKSVLNYTSANTPAAIQRVVGVSAEGRIAINENNYVIAEIAKSSFGNAGTQPSSSALINKAMNFGIRSNEAYSIKLYSQNPQTDTRVTAYYKKTGENFQSFNLYPVNVNQDAWMVKVNQQLWKKRFVLDAAIRKNDFVSPIAAPSFESKTIFKSIQASLRIPKYPFVSVGYYPSSQLSLSNNNVLIENQYNTFNSIISHSYQFKKIGMNTNASFTKFYNNSNDTGFIYYNASSLTLSHSIFLSSFMLQSSLGITDQKDLHLFTAEQLLSYQFGNKLTLGGSVKWNRLNKTENLFGGTAAMSLYLKKTGTLQFNYDKTYLPGLNKVLMPVDIGRMTFYREF